MSVGTAPKMKIEDGDIDLIVTTINKTVKRDNDIGPVAMTLADGELPCRVKGWIDTQCPTINEVIERPGIPMGRLTEVFGPEASGKTTLTAHILAECQQQQGISVLIDTEQAYDPEYAAKIGVDNRKLIVMQAECLEECYTMIETLITTIKQRNKLKGSERPVVIVLDSLGGTPAKAELEGDADDHHMAVAARINSKNLRRITQLIAREQIALIFTNQEYTKFTGRGGTTSKGGKAPKYHASVRLRVVEIGKDKDGDEITGSIVEVFGAKNKVGRPFRKRIFHIKHGYGIDVKRSYFDEAVACGLIEKNGSWYTFYRTRDGEVIDEVKFQGYNGFLEKVTGKKYVGLQNELKRLKGQSE